MDYKREVFGVCPRCGHPIVENIDMDCNKPLVCSNPACMISYCRQCMTAEVERERDGYDITDTCVRCGETYSYEDE